MTFYSVSNPFMQVLNLQGTGLNDGDVYFGVAGQDPITNPKTVYWDLAGTDVAPQPIPTTGGYLYRDGTPANVYINDTYSIKVLDKNGGLVYYEANVFDPVFEIIGPNGAEHVGFTQEGANAVPETAADKLWEQPVSPQDFTASPTAASNLSPGYVDAVTSLPRGGDTVLPRNGGNSFVNILIEQSAIRLRGQTGVCVLDPGSEPVADCVRPVLTGAGTATVQIGSGAGPVRRVLVENIDVSADNGSGVNADYAYALLGGVADCAFRNISGMGGKHTFHVAPNNNLYVTTTPVDGFSFRNDRAGADKRTIYLERAGPTSDVNFLTAFSFSNGHTNGPPDGFAIEVNGAAFGIESAHVNHYVDCKPWRGVLISGSSMLNGFNFQLDPGMSGAVTVQTDQTPGVDPTRFLHGNIRMGGQLIKYAGAVVTASIAAGVMTVTAVISGVLALAQDIDFIGMDHSGGSVRISSFGTGTGGTGTYNLSSSITQASTTITTGTTVTVDQNTEDFDFGRRSYSPFLGGMIGLTTAADPFGTSQYLGVGTGNVNFVGVDVQFTKNLIVQGGNATVSGTISSATATGGLLLSANGTVSDPDQNVRLDPAGQGVIDVHANGAKFPSYTVAQLSGLPTIEGNTVWCSNARNSGEGGGSGTGSIVSYRSGTGWRIPGVSTVVAA